MADRDYLFSAQFQDDFEGKPLLPAADFMSNYGLQDDGLTHFSHEVEFKNLYPGKIFHKGESRKWYKGSQKGRQVVKNGVVNMIAKYDGQLLRVRGWVRREPNAAKLFKDENGEVQICGDDNKELNLVKKCDVAQYTRDGYTLQPFSVDLENIYDGPKQPVFLLSRANTENINRFQLIIQLVFVDDKTSMKFVSPVFRCCTEKKEKQEDVSTAPKEPKRQRLDSGESSQQANSPWSTSGDSGILDSSQKHQHILVDTLDAKTANIKQLVYDRMTSSNADIAYHLRLKNPLLSGSRLQEGDMVGFFTDETTHDTYIEKLRTDNIHKAVHAGVISRSYWMEGNKPEKEGSTDTVCVIGIVNVKIVGSIVNGERIYASRHRPGMAIAQSQVPVGSFLRKKHVLLGMALESKKTSKTPDEVNLVKCFVCIVLDVSRQELLEEIEELYEVNETRTEEQIKIHSKKTWRRLKCCFATTVVFVALAIFALYQWLAPGSIFRYWLCRQGSIPNHHLYFKYKDVQNRILDVHGIEFRIDKLQDKVEVTFEENKLIQNGTASYYLNIDRCAYYWADGAAGNNIGGHKYIGASRILSVFRNCTTVYECTEMSETDSWRTLHRQMNVTCVPMPNE